MNGYAVMVCILHVLADDVEALEIDTCQCALLQGMVSFIISHKSIIAVLLMSSIVAHQSTCLMPFSLPGDNLATSRIATAHANVSKQTLYMMQKE